MPSAPNQPHQSLSSGRNPSKQVSRDIHVGGLPEHVLKPASVITIGNFDGVHLGHRALLDRCRQLRQAGGLPGGAEVIAVTFDPPPKQVLTGVAPPQLSTLAQRERLLLACGADRVERLHVTPALLELSPREFLLPLFDRLKVRAIVEGPDFRFGRRREGDVATLRTIAQTHGITVEIVNPVEVALDDQHLVPARSTVARWLLECGRVGDAARVLGRPHTLEGAVVRGDRRGRTIGYPTANLQCQQLAPADGVYAGWAELPDGRSMAAAISIGTKPTFGAHARAVEAFLIEQEDEIGSGGSRELRKAHWGPIAGLPEYGWALRLSFDSFIRDQIRFDDLGPLLRQMDRDCREVLRRCNSQSPPRRARASAEVTV